MSQPLLMTTRAEITYQVDPLIHKLRLYGDFTLQGGTWGALDRDLTTRHEATDIVSDLTTALLDSSGTIWEPTVTLTVEQLSGIIWNPVAVVAHTGAHGSNSAHLGSQQTFVLRDTAFKKVRIEVFETTFAVGQHESGATSIESTFGLFATWFSPSGLTPHKGFLWVKSRGNRYLLAPDPWVGASTDFNDKLMRRRGL